MKKNISPLTPNLLTLDKIKTFPRQPIDGGLLPVSEQGISVKLKRKLAYKGHHLHKTINPDKSSFDVSFKIIHKTKHTLIIEAKQMSFKNDLNNFILRIQISLDAKLGEVVSYQGEKAIPFFINISDVSLLYS